MAYIGLYTAGIACIWWAYRVGWKEALKKSLSVLFSNNENSFPKRINIIIPIREIIRIFTIDTEGPIKIEIGKIEIKHFIKRSDLLFIRSMFN